MRNVIMTGLPDGDSMLRVEKAAVVKQGNLLEKADKNETKD